MEQELTTILVGMAPILEVRGAIPIAIALFKFSPLKAYLLSVLGASALIIPLLFTWYYMSDFLMRRFYLCNRFFNWLFAYTRKKHENRFNYHHHHHWWFGSAHHKRPLLEFLALFLFVAIPFPLTGFWSGTVAAFVFGVPIRRAIPAIFSGILASGLIVLLIVRGIIALPF